MRDSDSKSTGPEVVVTTREFFCALVQDACKKRQIETFPLAENYLVDLLEHFLATENLYDFEDESGRKRRQTLAEMFLKASNAEPPQNIEIFKKLGDVSLYVSGFFGDSLQKKVVDLDYYAEMGVSAYSRLAISVKEDTFSFLYGEFSRRFLDFVEVLTLISQQALGKGHENILRLYERYLLTGSDLAKKDLVNQGLITVPLHSATLKKQ